MPSPPLYDLILQKCLYALYVPCLTYKEPLSILPYVLTVTYFQ